MTEQETRLRELIEQSHRIVFFGGAGVSTEIYKLVHHLGHKKIMT
mgnify:CR=1 FL=1